MSPFEWYSQRSMSVGHPKDSPEERMQHSACVQTSAPEVRPKVDSPRLSAASPSPVVGPVDIPEVGWVDSFSDPFLGSPIAFAQCARILGSDAPMTLPVYTLPSGAAYMMGQFSVATVLASGTSPRPAQWSTGTARMEDITREGPFDAFASPMDTEDSPLVTTGLPGCPYRIMSYNGPALSDMNLAFGLQLHHPRFLEFIGAPESAQLLYHSPSFWVDRLGEECAMAAAVNLQRDTGLMLSNLQIISQFVTSLHMNAVGDDVHQYRTCGVPCSRDCRLVYSSKGAAGGQVYGGDGSVAPSDGSG